MNIYIIFFISLLAVSTSCRSQEINWRQQLAHPHLLSMQAGADYSSWVGASYAYRLSEERPLMFSASLEVPFGNRLLDDWKGSMAGHYEIWHSNEVSWDVQAGLSMRTYQSDVASLTNLGLDLRTGIGYYGKFWGIAGLIGYDHAFATHIRHAHLKESYPGIWDGWIGATGGNIQAGIRLNYSSESWHTFLTIGKTVGQDLQNHPTLPFFLQLSLAKSL
ncbi:MAG: hypothetical protein AAF587_26630 [Bacteroidota bacterium]